MNKYRDWVGIAIVTVFCTIILSVVILVFIEIVGFHLSTGKGEHVGYVTAAETTGIYWKTMRVYFKTSQRSSQEDSYCVLDKNVYEKIKKIIPGQPNVKISYYSYVSPGVAYCGYEDAIISDITILKTQGE